MVPDYAALGTGKINFQLQTPSNNRLEYQKRNNKNDKAELKYGSAMTHCTLPSNFDEYIKKEWSMEFLL